MDKEIKTYQIDFEKISPWHLPHLLRIAFIESKKSRLKIGEICMRQFSPIWLVPLLKSFL